MEVEIYLLDAVGGWGDVDFRLEPGLGAIFCRDVLLEGIHRSGLDKIDGAAAEAAASHACANHTWLRGSDFDHEVELLAAHFVIVAQAAVRIAHQRTEGVNLTGF